MTRIWWPWGHWKRQLSSLASCGTVPPTVNSPKRAKPGPLVHVTRNNRCYFRVTSTTQSGRTIVGCINARVNVSAHASMPSPFAPSVPAPVFCRVTIDSFPLHWMSQTAKCWAPTLTEVPKHLRKLPWEKKNWNTQDLIFFQLCQVKYKLDSKIPKPLKILFGFYNMKTCKFVWNLCHKLTISP